MQTTIDVELTHTIKSAQPNILAPVPLTEFTQTKNSPLKSYNQLITPKERFIADQMHPMSAGIIKPPMNNLRSETQTLGPQF